MGHIKTFRHSAMAVTCAILMTSVGALPPFQSLDDLDVDLLHGLARVVSWNNRSQLISPTVVVAIDEATHATMPFAGVPKVMWTPQLAAVQNAILDGGAKVIGWDLILPTTAAAYLANRNYDAALLKSLARANKDRRIVLGAAQLSIKAIEPHKLFLWSAGGYDNLRSLNVPPDSDGVLRRVPTFLRFEKRDGSQRFVPSMALELAARMRNLTPVRTPEGGVILGKEPIHGAKEDSILLNFARSARGIPTYSLVDLFHCSQGGDVGFFERHFAGKVVLLGLVLDIEDRKLSSNRLVSDGRPIGPVYTCGEERLAGQAETPPRATTSAVYLHAAAVNNILLDEGLKRLTPFERNIVVFLVATLVSLVAAHIRLSLAVLSLVLAAGLWIALGLMIFWQGKILPMLVPMLVGFLTFFAMIGVRFVLLGREGRFLKRAFGSYVAPALVDQLVDDPGQLKLGGERREMSFLFTDIAGFTGLVESLDPEEAVRILNLYLDQMIEIAKLHGGTIDKVIGDAVVVLFSAPLNQTDHADRAVACALDMDRFAAHFAAEQRSQGIVFGQTRIGVNSGVAMIGNLGGSGFFDYTAIGDAMNTAARLEAVNQHLGTRIAVSGETARLCASFAGRMAGRLILKGRRQRTDVFEPLTDASAQSELFDRYTSAYGLLADEDGSARKAFESLASDFPHDALTQYHLRRLKMGQRGDVIRLAHK